MNRIEFSYTLHSYTSPITNISPHNLARSLILFMINDEIS